MAEPDRFSFTHKEIAQALVEKLGLNEGVWGIYLEFALAGANVSSPAGDLNPAAIVPVVKIGIQKFPTENVLTVNAAELSKVGKKRKTKAAKEIGKQKSSN